VTLPQPVEPIVVGHVLDSRFDGLHARVQCRLPARRRFDCSTSRSAIRWNA
jgi:hypothetical protein